MFEMTGDRPAAGAESVEAVSRRAADRTRRARRCSARSKARGRSWSRCRRSSARARYGNARRMASGIDQQRLSLLLAVLEKRAGLQPGRRRCVREHRRRDDRRRAGGRPRRAGGDRVERAQPGHSADDGGVRRGRAGGRGARHHAGGAARPRGGADGLPAAASCPRRTSTLPIDQLDSESASSSASARSARRWTSCWPDRSRSRAAPTVRSSDP